MDELRVPKRRVNVEFQLLFAPATRRLTVFLAEAAHVHDGPERLSDVLNGDTQFLPAYDEATRQMVFLARDAICFARLSANEEPADEAEGHTIPTECEVELRLAPGIPLRGLVSYVHPADRSRLNDYLNIAPSFFRVLEGDHVVLVNKRHLLEVVSLDS